MAGFGPGNIIIKVGAETGQAVTELSKVNGALGSSMTKSEKMGQALKRAAVPATIALGAIAVGAKKAIASASDLNEEVNKTEVIFGSSGKEVVAWSKTLAKSFGLSSKEALEAAGQIGNMLVPMGYSRKEAAGLSTKMVQLAGDMASFNNASPEETLRALQSGLAGQSRPLRQYGIFLDQTRIAAEAVAKGFVKTTVAAGDMAKAQAALADAHAKSDEALKKSGKGSIEYQKAQANVMYQEEKLKKVMDGKVPALNAQQKAAATMSLIMKDTADTQGDFARTSESAANQSRIQAAETENLSAALGQSLLPYYEAGQRILLSFTDALAGHTTAVKIAIGVVAGLSGAVLVANAAIKAYAIAQTAARAATIVATAAWRLLNLAFATSPIGLIVVAVGALAVGLVLAYKKSETFRDIVDGAFGVVKKAINAIGTAFDSVEAAAKKVYGWITDHWKVALFAFGPVGAAIALIATHFDDVKTAGVGAFNAITAAIKAVAKVISDLIDKVQSVVTAIGKIKIPKLPHIPGIHGLEAYGYGYAPAPATAGARATSSAGGGLTVNFFGPTDPEGAARAIARVLRNHDARQGRIAR